MHLFDSSLHCSSKLHGSTAPFSNRGDVEAALANNDEGFLGSVLGLGLDSEGVSSSPGLLG
eukprot:3428492-Pyramimonas_sp.AAC.1